MTVPDPHSYETAVGYHTALSAAGWTFIGHGVGAKIFRHGSAPDVLKVSDGDQCYLAFADYVAENWTPFLPKLDSIFRGEKWAVTRVEYLTPLNAKDAVRVNDWVDDYLNFRRGNQSPPLPTEWSTVLDDLFNIAMTCGCGLDLKPDNWMLRGDRIVLTDPLN